MKKQIINISLTVILMISLTLLIITFSISLPIYFRPFYYIQIHTLDLVEYSGFSYDVIKEAFDEMMDFLCWGKEFGTGELLYSESGKAHFVDCKVLFDLNITVFLVSLPISVIILFLDYLEIIEIKKPFGFHISFFSSLLTILIPVIVGICCVIDFSKAFQVFHKIFFPGKDNWLFNPYKDEIINVLPQEFFASCAALIGISILAITITCITLCIIKRYKALAK